MSWWHLQPWNLAGVGLVDRGGGPYFHSHMQKKKKVGVHQLRGGQGAGHAQVASTPGHNHSFPPPLPSCTNPGHCKHRTPGTTGLARSPLRPGQAATHHCAGPLGTVRGRLRHRGLWRAPGTLQMGKKEKEAELSKPGAPRRPCTRPPRWDSEAPLGGSGRSRRGAHFSRGIP